MAKKIIAIVAVVAVLAASVALVIALLPQAPDTPGAQLILGKDTRTEYRVGDEFTPPVVVLALESGEHENVSSSEHLSISGYDLQQKGSYTVHVRYDDGEVKASRDYKIEVLSNVVTDIKVNCQQESLIWGEKLDRTKLTVRAYFEDESHSKVEDYKLLYDNQPQNYGPVEVKVSYGGIDKYFTINVVGEVIDPKYKPLEDEAKRILNAMGVENPLCPQDYSLEIDIYGKAKLKAFFELDEGLTDTNQMLAYISGIFCDYTTNGEITDSLEMVLPSKKIVFINSEKQLQASVYFIQLPGANKQSFIIEELIIES